MQKKKKNDKDLIQGGGEGSRNFEQKIKKKKYQDMSLSRPRRTTEVKELFTHSTTFIGTIYIPAFPWIQI